MKKYKFIELNNNLEKNGSLGGILISKEEENSKVLLFNKNNISDFAIKNILNDHYNILGDLPDDINKDFANFLLDEDKINKNQFSQNKLKEYDKVKLIVENSKYSNYGVHKGATGIVISSYAIKNNWLVIFSEEDTGEDIATIAVKESDLVTCN